MAAQSARGPRRIEAKCRGVRADPPPRPSPRWSGHGRRAARDDAQELRTIAAADLRDALPNLGPDTVDLGKAGPPLAARDGGAQFHEAHPDSRLVLTADAGHAPTWSGPRCSTGRATSAAPTRSAPEGHSAAPAVATSSRCATVTVKRRPGGRSRRAGLGPARSPSRWPARRRRGARGHHRGLQRRGGPRTLESAPAWLLADVAPGRVSAWDAGRTYRENVRAELQPVTITVESVNG